MSGERFKRLRRNLAERGDVEDPDAAAAAIGRKKWGKNRFQEMAAAGRKSLAEIGVEFGEKIASGLAKSLFSAR